MTLLTRIAEFAFPSRVPHTVDLGDSSVGEHNSVGERNSAADNSSVADNRSAAALPFAA